MVKPQGIPRKEPIVMGRKISARGELQCCCVLEISGREFHRDMMSWNSHCLVEWENKPGKLVDLLFAKLNGKLF